MSRSLYLLVSSVLLSNGCLFTEAGALPDSHLRVVEDSCSNPSWSRRSSSHTAASTKKKKSLMGVEEMALALQWTGSLNQQLYQATHAESTTSSSWLVPRAPHHLLVRGGESSSSNQMYEYATIFHENPFPLESLQPLLRSAMEQLGLSSSSQQKEQSRLLTLALMYMDRATSVSTPRSGGSNKFPAAPYCTDRTIRRLTLAALTVAHRHLHPSSPAGLNVPEALIEHFVHSLGDLGTLVIPSQVQDFERIWMDSPLLSSKKRVA